MKKETEDQKLSAEAFNKTPVTAIIATDSDGTVVAANSDPKIQVPPREFVQQMREKSFENPELAIAIISGRADPYLNEHYSEAFTPDEEGKIPKIILLAENGAFLRTSMDPENLHTLTEPFSPEIKQQIVDITQQAAGEYFRQDDQNLDPQEISIWLDPKETTYGIFRRTPEDEGKREILKDILEEISTGLGQLQEANPDLHINLGAVDAFLVEKVSKGKTIEDLAAGNLQGVIANAGLETGTIKEMTYHGDDVADIPAQNAVNAMLQSGALEAGVTTRINDYSPNFSSERAELMTRTPPKSPKDASAQDTPYVLGSAEVSGQEQHQFDFLDQTTREEQNTLRVELTDKGLLPSQSGDAQTPPIVLLSTGDILIQEPERYPSEALDQLKAWDQGKVVLMANGAGPDSLKVKQLGLGENENLIAVSPEGQVFSSGQNLDFQDVLGAAKAANEIVSANPERSTDIQLLRAVQEVLVTNGLIQKKEQGQETVAAPALGNQDTKPAAVERAAPVQQAASVPAVAAVPGDLSALGTSTRAASARIAAASSISRRTRSADSQSPRKKSKPSFG